MDKLKAGAILPLILIFGLLIAIAAVEYFQHAPTIVADRHELPTIMASPVRSIIKGRARIVDGDTLEIHDTRIRLYGIDAPESEQLCQARGQTYRCGQDATRALASKVGNQTISCEPKDRDQYGRTVAVCFLGSEDINAWMVGKGWALAYRHYSTDYVSNEKVAAASKIGLWQGTFNAPWDWRRGDRRQSFQPTANDSPHAPPRLAGPQRTFYYQPGDVLGTSYRTMHECDQARQRAGNIGICVMK
jgi:endonuclease YncB( thermonuclease family)